MSLYDVEYDREKIVAAALSTVQLQADIIQSLLTSNKKLADGLSAAVRENQRMTEKIKQDQNRSIA
jgi:hypothetical protein